MCLLQETCVVQQRHGKRQCKVGSIYPSKQYIGNFLSVHRVCPMDEDESDANSDVIVSDEELQVSAASLKEALSTRIGGKDTATKMQTSTMLAMQCLIIRIQNLR